MNEIEVVIDVFEKQIQALYTNDFEKFLSFMTPRIQKELTIDIFQKAIDLYKHTPIDIKAIDHDKSKLYNEGESEEIPDKHVKLVLVDSGRTLCRVVKINDSWLIDDRYWRITDSEEEEEEGEGEEEVKESEDASEPISEPDSESEPIINDPETPPIEEIEESLDTEDTSDESMKLDEEKTTDDNSEEEEDNADEEHSK